MAMARLRRPFGSRSLRGPNWNCASTSNIVPVQRCGRATLDASIAKTERVQGGDDESLSRTTAAVAACRARDGPAERARDPVRFGAEFPDAAAGHEFRRGARRGGELQGPRLRVHALEQRRRPGLCAGGGAAARVHRRRPVCRRDRQGPLCLVVRPQRAHRQGRQHLGHRQGLRHDRQVQPGRPRRSGCSAAARNRRTRTPKPWEHVEPPLPADRRHVPPAHRRRLGFPGQHLHHRRLHQLARRQIRQERRLGEVVGLEGHRARPVPHAARDRDRQATTTSMSATAPTTASRCSTPTANSCACSRSTCRRSPAPTRSTATRRPASGSPR